MARALDGRRQPSRRLCLLRCGSLQPTLNHSRRPVIFLVDTCARSYPPPCLPSHPRASPRSHVSTLLLTSCKKTLISSSLPLRRLASLGIPFFQPKRDEATMRAAEEPAYQGAYLASHGRGTPFASTNGSHSGAAGDAAGGGLPEPLPGWVEVVGRSVVSPASCLSCSVATLLVRFSGARALPL